MNVFEVYKEFLNSLKIERNLSQATITGYNYDFKLFSRFLNRRGYSPTLDQLSPMIIKQFLMDLQESRPYKTSTIRRKIHSLRSFFNYCIEQDYLLKNPMRKIHTPKREQTIPNYLTDEEAERFINTPNKNRIEWLRKRDKAILDVLFYTGVRRAELMNLKLTDINLDEWSLKVRNGKGGKDRIIPLNGRTVKSLNEYLQVRPKSDVDHLFLSYNFSRKITKGGLCALFKNHLKNTKITRPGISLHSIRHTAACMILKGSKDLIAVQEILGHADLSTTRIYLHTTMEQLRNAIAKHPLG